MVLHHLQIYDTMSEKKILQKIKNYANYYGRVVTTKKPPPNISFLGTGGLFGKHKKESPFGSNTYLLT